MEKLNIKVIAKYCFFVMVEEVTPLVTIFLKKISDELKIEIRITHYPPYTSKYNSIEHRLFPHITRALEGVIFTSVELVNNLIAQTKMATGLKVFSSVLDRVFETKRKYAEGFKENMKIQFDEYLPNWNYVAIPKDS